METLATLFSSLDKKIPIAWILLILLIFVVIKINSIDHKLSNHITDTNKKIEHLTNRFDKLSDRFDRLYELLLKEKQNQPSKQK